MMNATARAMQAGSSTGTSMDDVPVRVVRKSYPVRGATKDELLASIEANGPQRGGERYAAYTEWGIRWNYELQGAHRGGRLVKVVKNPMVSVDVNVTLPEWCHPSGAPHALRKHWDAWLRNIRRHESEHVAFALKAGHDVLRVLSNARGQTRRAVDAVVGAAVDAVQKSEKEHDRVTMNGLTEGTEF